MSDRAYPKLPRCRRGKRHHHGGDVCGLVCSGRQYFLYYSYRKNPTGREFFIPARTFMAGKLFNSLTTVVAYMRPLFSNFVLA